MIEDIKSFMKDIEMLNKKIEAQDKIINTQALEIARLKERIEININAFLHQSKKIDKAIELIKRSAGYKGICTQPETDTFSKLLAILGEKE